MPLLCKCITISIFALVTLFLVQVQSAAGAAAAAEVCSIFGLPQLQSIPATFYGKNNCRQLLELDTNHNGIADWTNRIDDREFPFLVPLDNDINSNGIPNIFDPHPLAHSPNPDDTIVNPHHIDFEIPQHLQLFPTHPSPNSTKVDRLQEELFRQTGIIAVHYPELHRVWQLEAFLRVLTVGLPRGGARKLGHLRALYVQKSKKSLNHAKAYYVHDLQAIVISDPNLGNNKATDPELIETLAHELGHAAAFSLLSGAELLRMAQQFGPWKETLNINSKQLTLKNSLFLISHPSLGAPAEALSTRLGVPSRYALTNIHEWFAEIFAFWILEKLDAETDNKRAPSFRISPELSKALTDLFYSENRAIIALGQQEPRPTR